MTDNQNQMTAGYAPPYNPAYGGTLGPAHDYITSPGAWPAPPSDPFTPQPGTYPPHLTPQPIPGPYPPVGPQPTPIPPPHTTPPVAPVPFWPPPPPPAPVIADCALVRQVVAERTVGGIKKGSVLPAGLTYTLFVEWLLRGNDEEPIVTDEDPSATITLKVAGEDGVPAGSAALLTCTITKIGTAQPHDKVRFWKHPVLGDTGSSSDELVGEVDYVTGQFTFQLPLAALPTEKSAFYANFDYTREYAQTDAVCTTNQVVYTPPEVVVEDKVYAASIPYRRVTEMSELIPTVSQIKGMSSHVLSEITLSEGIQLTFPKPVIDGQTYTYWPFVSFPQNWASEIKWDQGMDLTPPEPVTVEIDGVRYNTYIFGETNHSFQSEMSILLKKKQ